MRLLDSAARAPVETIGAVKKRLVEEPSAEHRNIVVERSKYGVDLSFAVATTRFERLGKVLEHDAALGSLRGPVNNLAVDDRVIQNALVFERLVDVL